MLVWRGLEKISIISISVKHRPHAAKRLEAEVCMNGIWLHDKLKSSSPEKHQSSFLERFSIREAFLSATSKINRDELTPNKARGGFKRTVFSFLTLFSSQFSITSLFVTLVHFDSVIKNNYELMCTRCLRMTHGAASPRGRLFPPQLQREVTSTLRCEM